MFFAATNNNGTSFNTAINISNNLAISLQQQIAAGGKQHLPNMANCREE